MNISRDDLTTHALGVRRLPGREIVSSLRFSQ
jgi:hypothetical protein